MNAQELTHAIRARGAVLFGTGFVAGMFLSTLERLELGICVQACAVSEGGGNSWRGLPVYDWDELPAHCHGVPVVCLAVHESVAEALLPYLRETWGGDVVWIYPLLFPLAFGEPGPVTSVPLESLLASQAQEDGALAVRYAAADVILKGGHCNDTAFSLYGKAIGLFSSPATAARRLDSFRRLCEGVRSEGLDPARPILLDSRSRIIDGQHRASAAVALGLREVSCATAPSSDMYDVFFDRRTRFTLDAVREAKLTPAEADCLAAAQTRLVAIADERRLASC